MKRVIDELYLKLRIAAILVIALFLVTCQKDVDSIQLKYGIDISSFIYNSENRLAITGAIISVNGDVVTQSDNLGSFTLRNVKAGVYSIEITKSGFSSGYFKLIVENCQGTLPIFLLKTLAPPVEVDATGGSVKAYYSTGKLAAEIVIPANSIQSKKKISSTVLFGNEIPQSKALPDKIQGTVVQFSSEEPNVVLKTAELKFVLPFNHRPGDKVEVIVFNESKQTWETYDYAVVEPDGLTVKITVENLTLNIFSINLNGSYTEVERVKLSCDIVANSLNYLTKYEWTSYLNYLTTIPGKDATAVKEIKLYLNQLIEMYSGHIFSQITYKGLPTETFPKSMIFNITAPPLVNPTEYSALKVRAWELVKHDCLVTNKVILKIFDPVLNSYVDREIISRYLTSSYDWVWRGDDTYGVCDYLTCSSGRVVIPINEQHSGGGSN